MKKLLLATLLPAALLLAAAAAGRPELPLPAGLARGVYVVHAGP